MDGAYPVKVSYLTSSKTHRYHGDLTYLSFGAKFDIQLTKRKYLSIGIYIEVTLALKNGRFASVSRQNYSLEKEWGAI